jgi:tetratricopeptide (TPR) repeat protein
MIGLLQFFLYALLILGGLVVSYYVMLAIIRGFQLQVLELQLRRQIALKNYPLALATLQQAFRINPTHADIYFQRAKIYAALGDFLSAEADFTAGLKVTRNAPAYAGRAAARLRLGRTNEALIDANHVIACSRLWWRGYYERGRVYQALGHFQIALDDFDQALELNRLEPAEILLARSEASTQLVASRAVQRDYGRVAGSVKP